MPELLRPMDLSLYGPDPIGSMLNCPNGNSSELMLFQMCLGRTPIVRFSTNGEYGCFKIIFICLSSTISTLTPSQFGRFGLLREGSWAFSMVKATSLVVIGVLSWNVSFGFKTNVYVKPSGEIE